VGDRNEYYLSIFSIYITNDFILSNIIDIIEKTLLIEIFIAFLDPHKCKKNFILKKYKKSYNV
jgi:hypothetical protein